MKTTYLVYDRKVEEKYRSKGVCLDFSWIPKYENIQLWRLVSRRLNSYDESDFGGENYEYEN